MSTSLDDLCTDDIGKIVDTTNDTKFLAEVVKYVDCKDARDYALDIRRRGNLVNKPVSGRTDVTWLIPEDVSVAEYEKNYFGFFKQRDMVKKRAIDHMLNLDVDSVYELAQSLLGPPTYDLVNGLGKEVGFYLAERLASLGGKYSDWVRQTNEEFGRKSLHLSSTGFVHSIQLRRAKGRIKSGKTSAEYATNFEFYSGVKQMLASVTKS